MRTQGAGARRRVIVGIVVGASLGTGLACAKNGKGSRNPEQCMTRCEQEQCAYDPNEVGNDEYLECLDACQDECS